MNPAVRIEGLKEFRKALRDADNANPRELTKALKAAGAPVPPAIAARTPVRTGALKASIGKPQASGTKGRIPIKAKHAAIIEFAKNPRKRPNLGPTLTRRYGPAPRFAYPALDSVADEVQRIAYKELKEIVTAYGWFRE